MVPKHHGARRRVRQQGWQDRGSPTRACPTTVSLQGKWDRPRDGSQVLLRQELRQVCGDKQVQGPAENLIYKLGTVPVLVTHVRHNLVTARQV